ncbi:helix-turn-helix domain-containing protein [Aquimarina sp. 2201CG5-10]|uniref:MarR family transcriptional regulator n=1 Tax=Aquimarina callyspongiae TaxID=3098150 RepID=UPI002AB47895|nr:helix-turn-helix domain-containing protein [Aquimarina sp. 2201CG5-10]MDY8137602.1 helix-turn-helix domain-containing protein [Aquimarina sp. 2201CG5-10]
MKARIKTLLNQIQSGRLETDISRVLDHIKTHPFTTLPEIKKKLCLAHQTASARISDLLDLGLIEEKGEKKTSNGTYSYFKFQPDYQKQECNASKRKKEKYDYWVKKGLTQFKEFINPKLKKQLRCTK